MPWINKLANIIENNLIRARGSVLEKYLENRPKSISNNPIKDSLSSSSSTKLPQFTATQVNSNASKSNQKSKSNLKNCLLKAKTDRTNPNTKSKLSKSLVEIYVSDIHFPYEDKKCWSLFLDVCRDLEPDIIFLGGDIVDFYSISSYDKDPRRKFELQNELDYCSSKLKQLRNILPNARFIFKVGNHETRIMRFLSTKAEELSILRCLDLKELLGLRDINAEFISNMEQFKIGKLYHLHGNERPGGGVNIARSMFLKYMENVIFGHFHRIQIYTSNTYEGKEKAAYANGCLCNIDACDFIHKPDWQNGFSIIRYVPSGMFHVEQVQIYNRANGKFAMVGGKEYFK